MATSAPTITTPPLTASFSPSPACFTNITWYRQSSGYYGGDSSATIAPLENCGESCWLGLPQTSDCFPRSWSLGVLYSPGVCPGGYSPACSSTYVRGSKTHMHTTCCPSGFRCPNYATDYKGVWFSTEPCLSPTAGLNSITALADITQFSTSAFMTTVPTIETRTTYPSTTYPYTTESYTTEVYTTEVYPTQVYPAYTKYGQPVYAYGILIQSQSNSKTTGLSTGAKAGIGVAVSLLCVGFVVGFVLFWRWRRRRQSRQQADRSTHGELTDEPSHVLFPKVKFKGKRSSAALHSAPQMAVLESPPTEPRKTRKPPRKSASPFSSADLAPNTTIVSRKPVSADHEHGSSVGRVPGVHDSSDSGRFPASNAPSSQEIEQINSGPADQRSGSVHDQSSIHRELLHIATERERLMKLSELDRREEELRRRLAGQ